MADTKLSALTEVSVPDFSDDVYLVDNTGPTSYKVGTDRFFGLGGFIPGGRLTLTTAVPITTADVTAAGTLYYTPYLHNRIRVYDGTRWIYYAFAELSLSLTLTSGKNYDVFVYDNSGTLTLELSAAWTTDTARADALTTQDAVTVKSGATTRLWLGTIRASGTNTTEDSWVNRLVWNTYNRVDKPAYRAEDTDHTLNNTAAREWNNASAARIGYVCGAAEDAISHSCIVFMQWSLNTTPNPIFYTARDTTSGRNIRCYLNSTTINPQLEMSISDVWSPLLGYHYLTVREQEAASVNVTADKAMNFAQLKC